MAQAGYPTDVKNSPGDIERFSDPLQTMLGYQLRRASVAAMTALADELATLDLKPSEASLIMLVGANPGCTQSAIGRALPAKSANLVPLVNQLVAIGALERTPGRGRAVALSLSKAGRALHAKVTRAFERNERVLSRHLGEDARGSMLTALRQICRDACSGHHTPSES
jgi:DNA-binding MarR family transcriptional regulator